MHTLRTAATLVLLAALPLGLTLSACTEVDAPEAEVERDVEDAPQVLETPEGEVRVEDTDAGGTTNIDAEESIRTDEAVTDVQVQLQGDTVEIAVETRGVSGEAAQLKAQQYIVEAFRAIEADAPGTAGNEIGLTTYAYHVVVRDENGEVIVEARKAPNETALTYGGS